jgi:uncharacterized protein (TIGR03382 family)
MNALQRMRNRAREGRTPDARRTSDAGEGVFWPIGVLAGVLAAVRRRR